MVQCSQRSRKKTERSLYREQMKGKKRTYKRSEQIAQNKICGVQVESRFGVRIISPKKFMKVNKMGKKVK
jgi:hypothetical protein